jgi:UDP-2-acetamido-3-amino-2,3-dideoxy-glucuronate N-acetyltransferase
MIIFCEMVNIGPFMHYFSHPTAVIDPGASIGAGTKIWHFSHIMSGAVIGEDCTIGQNVMVEDGVILGNGVKVQNNVSLYTGLVCEEDVFIGPSVVFTNVINPRSAIPRKDQYRRTLVRKGASIGANATIICGNEIGEYAFVGAGAVLTHPALPYALLTGNPARQTGWISEYGHSLHFDATGRALCPESGQAYQLQDEQIIKVTGNE